MKLINLKEWGRIILPAFLLIIFIQGVLFLPEVRVGFFPEMVWQDRFRQVAKECGRMKDSLTVLEADVARLNYPLGPGFSPDPNNFGNGRGVDFSQMVINAWYSMAAPAGQYSFKRDHYLARKKFVHAEMRLNNIELMLDNLLFSTNFHRIDGIAYRGNHDTVLIQKQIHAFRQKCQQYENKLNIQAKRLQQIRLYADKQINSSGRGISTRN